VFFPEKRSRKNINTPKTTLLTVWGSCWTAALHVTIASRLYFFLNKKQHTTKIFLNIAVCRLCSFVKTLPVLLFVGVVFC